MARLGREGDAVHIQILGEGATSRYRKREEADLAIVRALEQKSRRAAKLVGAKSVGFERLPDNRFDTVPLLDVIKKVEDAVKKIRPSVIYTHHQGDLNVDHRVVHQAVLTATRPMKGHPVREIYAFEIPSSTEWAFHRPGSGFWANTFVDISRTLNVKIRALSEYETEVRDFPHPRSPEAIRATAVRWGSVVGCDAAEAFELVRAIR